MNSNWACICRWICHTFYAPISYEEAKKNQVKAKNLYYLIDSYCIISFHFYCIISGSVFVFV